MKTAALQGIKQGLENAMNSGGQSYEQQSQHQMQQARAQEEVALAAQQQDHEILAKGARSGQEQRDKKIAELSAQLAGPPKTGGDMSGLVAGLPAGKQPLDTELERLKTEGGSGWDTKGKLLGEKPKEPPKPTLFDPSKTEAKDIPKERRTPEVNKWLDEREDLRKERAKLEQEQAVIDKQDTVTITKKQIEIDKVRNKENFCSFELTEELRKQPAVTPEAQ